MDGFIKRALTLLLAITMIFAQGIVAFAADETGGQTNARSGGVKTATAGNTNGYVTSQDVETALSTAGIDPLTDRYTVELVSNADGTDPAHIDSSAFFGCTGLTGVTIPDTVYFIGNYAFFNCTRLTDVTIPKNVSAIYEQAFGYCTSLQEIKVDPQNDNYSSVSGVLFTEDKTKLICYPAGKRDASYTVPERTGQISDNAFRGCESLKSVSIPSATNHIGDYAFLDCAGLQSINVDSGNPQYTSIDGVLLYKSKTGLICYPAGKQAANYTIPSSVEIICDSAFAGCDSLKSVTIPASVETICESAFLACTGLTDITIPASVTDIYRWAFGLCESLNTITFLGATPPAFGDYIFEGCDNLEKIIVPKGKLLAYRNALMAVYDMQLVEIVETGSQTTSSSSKSSSKSSGADRAAQSANTPADVTKDSAANAAKSAAKTAKAAGSDTTVVTVKNPAKISLEALKEMRAAAGMPVKFNADSMSPDGKSVDVRISLDPSKATKGLDLSASTTNAAATANKFTFEKRFSNRLSAVSFGQQGDFGMDVSVAVKADFSGADPKDLCFYSYDNATNTYKRIEISGCRIDKNGYLHFTTGFGGNIIISEGPLAKK